jgi:hypothetical protein
MVFSWFRQAARRVRPSPSPRQRRPRPLLEALENRLVLSNVIVNPATGTVTANIDSGANASFVIDPVSQNDFDIIVNGKTLFGPASPQDVKHLIVNLGVNDSLTLGNGLGMPFALTESVQINGGAKSGAGSNNNLFLSASSSPGIDPTFTSETLQFPGVTTPGSVVFKNATASQTLNLGVNAVQTILDSYSLPNYTVSDQNSTVQTSYFIDQTGVGPGQIGIQPSNRNSGSFPTIDYNNKGAVTVIGSKTGSAFTGDTCTVEATVAAVPVTIDAQQGNDTVNVGNGSPGPSSILSSIGGTVNVNGGNLNIGDASDTNNQTWNISEKSITTTAAAGTINYTGLTSLNFDGGSGVNVWNVAPSTTTASFQGLPLEVFDHDTVSRGQSQFNITVDPLTDYGNSAATSGSLGPIFVASDNAALMTVNDPIRASSIHIQNPPPYGNPSDDTTTVSVTYLPPGVSDTIAGVNLASESIKPDADHSFVQALFFNDYGRTGTQAELDYWVNQLPDLGQAGVAEAIRRTAPTYQHAVDVWFQKFLGGTNPAAEAPCVAELAGGPRRSKSWGNSCPARISSPGSPAARVRTPMRPTSRPSPKTC